MKSYYSNFINARTDELLFDIRALKDTLSSPSNNTLNADYVINYMNLSKEVERLDTNNVSRSMYNTINKELKRLGALVANTLY